MDLKLDHCEDADMHRFFEIVSLGFGWEHEYFNMVFPRHDTPSGRDLGGQRLLGMKKSDPNSTFLKVTDTVTGEIIGIAKWNTYDGVVPPETGLGTKEFWDTAEEAEYADAMYGLYLEERRNAIKESEGHLVSLDLLAVDPKHHYRGAGRMLVDWGVRVADDLGVVAVVEGSVYARNLYEACGFQKIRHVTIQPPKKFEHLAKQRQRFLWMVRPKKSTPAQNVKESA